MTPNPIEGLFWARYIALPNGTWAYGIGLSGPLPHECSCTREEVKRKARDAVLAHRKELGIELLPEPRVIGDTGKPFLREASDVAGGVVRFRVLGGAWLPNEINGKDGKAILEAILEEFRGRKGET